MIRLSRFRISHRNFVRCNSSSTIPQVKKRPTFRQLLKTPTTKSLLLTILFGSTVTEMIARRRTLETLRENHATKMAMLLDVIERLKKGEQVDLQQELRLLNNLSEDDSNIEIEWDEKLQQMLKDEISEPPSPSESLDTQPVISEAVPKPATSKFL